MGPEALCTEDYCDCDGTAAPLLSSQVSVSGMWTTNCAYTTQPATDGCPVTVGGQVLPVGSAVPTYQVEGIQYVYGTCVTSIGGGETCSGDTTIMSYTTVRL
jgi:hypothetical protein